MWKWGQHVGTDIDILITLIISRFVCIHILQYLCPFPCNLNSLEAKDIGGIQYLLSLNNMFKKRYNFLALHAAWIGQIDMCR